MVDEMYKVVISEIKHDIIWATHHMTRHWQEWHWTTTTFSKRISSLNSSQIFITFNSKLSQTNVLLDTHNDRSLIHWEVAKCQINLEKCYTKTKDEIKIAVDTQTDYYGLPR